MNARQRKNLLKLAAYLESLPANYKHFDMEGYADHRGDCDLPMDKDLYAAKKPHEFLANCGSVACAVGHGPAAGIRLFPEEVKERWNEVSWSRYADRAFGADDRGVFHFLFDGDWTDVDNHHYGAAARIRYYLATNEALEIDKAVVRKYAPYRKGSRSAKRREIEAVPA